MRRRPRRSQRQRGAGGCASGAASPPVVANAAPVATAVPESDVANACGVLGGCAMKSSWRASLSGSLAVEPHCVSAR